MKSHEILLLIYRKFLERSDMKTRYILAVFSRNKAGFPRLNIEKISNNNVKLNRFLKKEPRIVIQNNGMLPVKRTIKNNKFLYRQPCYGWRYFMLLLYIAHDISLVSLHAVSFEVVGCCSNLCN